MRNLFKSRASAINEAPALPAPAANLIPAFDPDQLFPATAQYSNRFRTRARKNEGDDTRQFWMQAAEVSALSGWLVSHVEKSPNMGRIKSLPDDAPVLNIKRGAKPVSLREAVTQLSEFEHGGLVNETLTGPTKKELGDLHYEAAALKEGITFDSNGQPHAILNGMIVSDGFFTEEAYEAALKAQAPEQNPAKQISLVAIAGMMGTDDLIGALEHRVALVRFTATLKEVHQSLKKVLREKSDSRFDDSNRFFEVPNRYGHSYAEAVGQSLAKLDTNLEAFEGLPMHKALSMLLYQYQLFALTIALKDAYNHLEIVQSNYRNGHVNMIEDGLKYFMAETCKLIEKNGGDADKVRRFKNLILLQDTNESVKQIELILNGIEKDSDILVNITEERLRKLAQGDCYGLFDKLGMQAQEAPKPQNTEPTRRGGGVHFTA